MGRILAMGGHEFERRLGNDALCDLVIELAGDDGGRPDGRPPRICLLPTAGGDSADQIARFRNIFGERDCDPSAISLFRLGESPMNLRDHLLSQDAIYVGGGSLVNLVAIWRAHGIDSIVREAYERGILLCGQSAGAMIWFEQGVTTSHGAPAVAPGLGILQGSACVHYHAQPERRKLYLSEVAGELPAGYGLDDQAGAVFEQGRLVDVVSARPGASAWRVEISRGGLVEEELEPRRLGAASTPLQEPGDKTAEIIELRRTLAARSASRRSRGGIGR